MTFKLNDTGASARVNDFFTRTTQKFKKTSNFTCSNCILLFFSYQIAMLANASTDSSAREIDLVVSA